LKRHLLPGLLLLCSLQMFATTVVSRSVEELAARSSNVVVGKAIRTWSQWNADHTVIFTYSEFSVDRSLKGQAGKTVVVKQLGGSADGITQKVAGLRHLQTGEQAVLFLHPSDQRDGTLAVTSLMQGHFRVSKSAAGDMLVSNGVNGASSFDRASGHVSSYRGSAMKLSELEERVRKVSR
jgi:hypothetical protein